MDSCGVVAMDTFLCSSSSSENVGGGGGLLPSSSSSSPPPPPPPPICDAERAVLRNIFEANFVKHERRLAPQEIDWRLPKAARREPVMFPPAKAAHFFLGSGFPDGEQMLSFGSPTSADPSVLSGDGAKTLTYYCCDPPWSSSCLRSEGLSSGGLNASMHGTLATARGPFTPSQWMELEHQALIYKYLAGNAPIPPNLLIPIRQSLASAGFSPFSAGYYGSSSSAWGSFHLGCSGNADPEPGRCRRTDGKKWRCSRDAVADQKYCERHMNRGRHRSRKHVEGNSNNAAKALAAVSTSRSDSTAVSENGPSSSCAVTQQPTKDMSPNMNHPCPVQLNRMLASKGSVSDAVQDSHHLSMQNSVIPKPVDSLFDLSKQHNPFEESTLQSDFGIVSSEPRFRSPRNSDDIGLIPTPNLDHEHPGSRASEHFIEWSSIHTQRSAMTQLSISIPVASSDMSSSPASTDNEKSAPSPLRLTRNLGLDGDNQGEATWSVFCGASMGGPLGEVLINNNTKDQRKNSVSSALNLSTGGWDFSAQLESSPTGVLQRTAFGSVTSSTGSSPPLENRKAHDGIGNRQDDLGSILAKHPKMPLL